MELFKTIATMEKIKTAPTKEGNYKLKLISINETAPKQIVKDDLTTIYLNAGLVFNFENDKYKISFEKRISDKLNPNNEPYGYYFIFKTLQDIANQLKIEELNPQVLCNILNEQQPTIILNLSFNNDYKNYSASAIDIINGGVIND